MPSSMHRTALLITVNACMFVFGVVLLLMGSLLPTMHVSQRQAGALGSFPLAGILIATLAIGPFLDKAGAKHALAAALGLITLALAVVPSLGSYRSLVIAALAYGLGGGVLNTATNALVAELNASGRAAALNLLGFFFSLGAITAPLLMSSLGAARSPGMVLRVLALLSGILLILALALHFPAPQRAEASLGSLLRVWREPTVWLFAAFLFFESGNENCMFVWAGKVAADFLKTTAQRAELVLLGLSIALGAGRLLALLWLKLLGSRMTLWLSAAGVVAGAVIIWGHPTYVRMLVGFATIGFGLSAIYPTALGLAGDHFPKETGTVFGAIMTVGLIGGVAGPALGGLAAGSGPLKVLAIPIVAAVAVAALTAAITRGLTPARS
jgi:FHS family glucose/mannose:H+ symporter-like MFS transporter